MFLTEVSVTRNELHRLCEKGLLTGPASGSRGDQEGPALFEEEAR